METIQSYLQLCNYSGLFYTELYPVVPLMLDSPFVTTPTHLRIKILQLKASSTSAKEERADLSDLSLSLEEQTIYGQIHACSLLGCIWREGF